MVSLIYQVKILNDTMSLTDLLAIISLVISLISVAVVLIDKYLAHKSKEMSLSCSVNSFVWDEELERFFVFMSFSNKSSVPLVISSVDIRLPETEIPNDKYQNSGGLSLPIPHRITGFQLGEQSSFSGITFEAKSLPFPITLAPYTSTGGFVAFACGGNSARVIAHKGEVIFKIRTTRYPLIFSHDFLLDNQGQYYYEGKNHVNRKRQE